MVDTNKNKEVGQTRKASSSRFLWSGGLNILSRNSWGGNKPRNTNLYQKIIILLIMLSVFSMNSACIKTYSGAKQLAIDLAKELKITICKNSQASGKPCKDRDVRQDADLGNAVYLYVYGVTDPKEMDQLVQISIDLRNNRHPSIPIYITFYKDTSKTHKIKTIKLEGN